MAEMAVEMTREERRALDAGFGAAFGGTPERYFSAPGRTEIGGNHTDHQGGRVLAAAVDLDTRCAVRINGSRVIRVLSQGYALWAVDLENLNPVPEEINTTPGLIRGVAAWFAQRGCLVAGFDAYVTSTVLPGSGLSSSAAFEVLLGTVINHLFFGSKATAQEVAMAGQYAENVFFGKPCGLMDQMASAVGNLVAMDFGEHPEVAPVDFDFSQAGHALCILDTHASHAELTEEYAAIPGEMGQIAACFGKKFSPKWLRRNFTGRFPPCGSSAATGRCFGPCIFTGKTNGWSASGKPWRPGISRDFWSW